MIATELHLVKFAFVIFLLIKPSIIVDAGAGRCYLCSEHTLAQCAGSAEPNSPVYSDLLQYYTEPCNGQCVLFRSLNNSIIRGCSWTYGHMNAKSTGWHELSSGIEAYFCSSSLCNNGSYERPDLSTTTREIIIATEYQTPKPTPTPAMLTTDQPIIPIDPVSRQLRQCYSCTARVNGCGEFLDPRFAAKFIQPCSTSCLVFRNPNDHNFITRDCATKWPQVRAKSGLHKLLGTDAFFCQESLCNGISFEFIMGIFHNQLPAVIKFPSMHPIESVPAVTIVTSATTNTVTLPLSTTTEMDESNIVWEDTDEDDVEEDFSMFSTTTSPVTVINTSPFLTNSIETTNLLFDSSTIPVSTMEHFDFNQQFVGSSTIVGGLAVAQQDSQLNWWDVSDAALSPLMEANNFPPTKTTTTTTTTTMPILKPSPFTKIDQDDWSIFDTSTIASMNYSEQLIDSNADLDFDMNDHFFSTLSTTPPIDSINNNNNGSTSSSFIPYYFDDYKPKDPIFDPMPTLAMPPFTWMLQLASQNGINNRKIISNKTISTNTTTIKKKEKKKKMINEHCNQKKCQNGGRLNSNCICICLPAYSGDVCEIDTKIEKDKVRTMANQQISAPPRDFLCPITRELMQNPVLLIEDGHSYELHALQRWLRDHNSSPMTNKPLRDRRFVHNFNLKNAIEEFCTQQETISLTNQFLSFNFRSGRTPPEWQDKPTLKIRLSLLGGSNVGKTTLARCLQYGSQSSFVHLHISATVGPDLVFFYLDQLYENKYVIIIQLADIPGMERYESCCDNHFRNCHGALLLSDSTDIDSLERTELYWYKQLQTKGKDDVEAVLVCNKIDIFETNCDVHYRRIFFQRAEHFASTHNMPIHYISALRGDNIQSMFKQLILRILHNSSLLQQIKETSTAYEQASNIKESIRRTSSIQVSIQPESPSSSSRQNDDNDRNSSGSCCKFA
ncbi:unnamed protein product [Rotaria socialis]|uniref:U-box domain-containing protein n=1 Tax=Rotaria socialis TaxID=392032 RepID=A0A820NUU1_9BILA|nr:unnamed protein product [Rotaria socialis]